MSRVLEEAEHFMHALEHLLRLVSEGRATDQALLSRLAEYLLAHRRTAEAHRTYISNINDAAMAEACSSVVHIVFCWEHQQLPDRSRWEIDSHEHLQQAIKSLEAAVMAAGEVTRLAQKDRVVAEQMAHIDGDTHLLRTEDAVHHRNVLGTCIRSDTYDEDAVAEGVRVCRIVVSSQRAIGI